ncbi:hypothetical protein LEMA_P056150.1 [Plenodomus lingam JN3]|uniref:Uncharacterized protein n=1 Tax=Leptosphaeria maculans (strain JN3 / isolate v23.1.3 / race Av1-4-5-6-7-8) TaxID=985895 RepID=E4ZMP0_LEPMJ|nr:hypothetical protein LEMA_P056150.1 [Plenodomus lingam JN3]CBX92909.1 hypothetical protein LEMA_P056150.1 [Plenodomus lingam JN3]
MRYGIAAPNWITLVGLFSLTVSASPVEAATPYCGMVQDTNRIGHGLYVTSQEHAVQGVASRLGQCQSLHLNGAQAVTYQMKGNCSCYFFNDENCDSSYFIYPNGETTVQTRAYKCCLSIRGVQGTCAHCRDLAIMRLSILTSLLFGGVSVICNPIRSTVIARGGSGYVTDTLGNQYALYDTGDSNIRAITDKINGEYMRPVSYSISSGHACKFWSEATRGIGYLIGEFTGPVHAAFGHHWAAFFECLDLTIGLPVGANHGPAGNVLDSNGVVIMLRVEEELTIIGMKEGYYHPKNLHIAEGYLCEFHMCSDTSQATHSPRILWDISSPEDVAGQI